jgi:predicted ABC-type transport system involved in lysophospholipase L1 biosynthesis ATPase subunit
MPELNTLENVMLAAKILGTPDAEFKARTLIESVGLGSRLNHYPAQLSGGECQRVAIARALINDPTIVLADEPTGNLDEVTGQQIINLLLGIVAKKQMALILVTHSREYAERTQRQLLLTKGVLSPG